MALVNGGYLHYTDRENFFSLKVPPPPPPKKKKKKSCYGPLKNSGERCKAIVALLPSFSNYSEMEDFSKH